MGTLDAVLVAINHNVSFVGKTWWLLMVGLRLIVVLLAGFTLFSDEQERFVCNTIQPGCSNVCFNLFAPVSLFRLWLLHIVLLSLPHLMFATHVAHRLLWDPNSGAGYVAMNRQGSRGSPCSTPEISQLLLLHHHHHHLLGGRDHPQCVRPMPSFHYAYLLVVMVRILIEAAFAAGHFLLFGLFVPRSFLCYEAPCTSGVQCYVSRATEKTLMLNLMLGLACLSVMLSLVDLAGGARRALRWRRGRRREMSASEEMSKGEQSSVSSNVSGPEDTNLLLNKRTGDEFESDSKATPSFSADTAPVAAAAPAKGGADCMAGKPTEEKGSPWKHNGNGEVGFSTKPKATPLHFVLHNQQNPPELAAPDGSLPPRLVSFTPAGTRRQGQLASVGSTSSSRKNSTPSEGPDKRAWV